MYGEVKEEIKARLPVEDVIGQYVELKRAGRTLKGRSPWGVDKTPSFMVSPEKGIWHDFSANKGGDIFTFIMEVEGISFREALTKLASQAGVDIQKYGSDDIKVAKRKVRAKEAVELATKFYQWSFSKSKKTQEYAFYQRNLNKKTIEDFRIGYAPAEGKVLKDFLTKRGYSVSEMRDGGLLNRFDGDMFRARLMVPFIDTNGSVIGFTARILSKGEPKYLNTSETILFNKSRFVFGLYQAKEAIRRNGYIVIVEGNMDVISSHQAGVREAVATSGTAMTEQHLKILSRLSNDIRIAYDGDEAGVRATERAIKMASELGIKLTVICDYHGAKDPDELIQKDPELWKEAVLNSKPAVDYLLLKYEEKLDLSTADGKQEYWEKAKQVIQDLPLVSQKHYKKKIAKRLDVEISDLEDDDKTGGDGTIFSGKRYKKIKDLKVDNNKNSVQYLKILDNIQAIIVYGGTQSAKIEVEIPEDSAKLQELELIFNELYGGWEREALEKEVVQLYEKLKEIKRKIEIEELNKKLQEAEEKEDETEAKILLEKILVLQRGEQ